MERKRRRVAKYVQSFVGAVDRIQLDATRLGEVAKGREDKILAANCKTLLDYTSRIWKNIRRSLDVCPAYVLLCRLI